MATVYRMINALEEIGAISRKNMYRVECGKTCSGEGGCEIILEDDTVFQDAKRETGPDRPDGARRCGYLGKGKKISKIIYHNGQI